jgi:sugar/nucleoside kinase (ribokinase family)
MTHKGAIVAIGEALVEIMRPGTQAPLDQEGSFEGPFASGAPAIFAVAAARMGLPVRFIGAVGEDAFGRLLRRRLEAEDVEAFGLQAVPGRATGVAFVAYAADGRREFVFHLRHAAAGAMGPEHVRKEAFEGAAWLHISGSTLLMSESCRKACWKAVDQIKAAGGRLSFDPNLRPELLPNEQARLVMADFLEAADLLLPTEGEAHILAGMDDDDRAARKLLGAGEKVVALKRGAQGCTAYTGSHRVDAPGFRVTEVDPTGAGDCFNAAFVYGLQAGWGLERTARYACAAGALAVTRQGPMEGAPRLDEVEAFLRR